MYKLLLLAVVGNVLLVSSHAYKTEKHVTPHVNHSFSRFNFASTKLMGQFLYQQVIANPYQTFATSTLPALSIAGIMGLYSEGATYEEISQMLNLNKNEIKEVFQYAMPIYTSKQEVKSTLKHKIYGDGEISYRNNFVSVLHKIFDGKTEKIDASKPYEAAEKINNWPKSQDNKTENVITPCEIYDDYGLYVVSFHEFEVNWANPFNPQGKRHIQFHVNSAHSITMPAMYGNGYLNYADYDRLNCELVELPLSGNKYYVFLMLPKQQDGLPTLLEALRDPEEFNKAHRAMSKRCIDVHVPLGEVHTVVDIKKSLIAANYSSLFDPERADLKCISKKNNDELYLSQFRHAISLIGNSKDGNNPNSTGTSSSDVCYGRDNKRSIKFNRPFLHYVITKPDPNIVVIMGGLYFGNT